MPGTYELVFNTGEQEVEHQFRRSIPVDRSAHVTINEDGKSGTIHVTRTTQITANVFDVTECTEAEVQAIAAKFDGHHVIPDGRHGLEAFSCARLMEERSYDVGDAQ